VKSRSWIRGELKKERASCPGRGYAKKSIGTTVPQFQPKQNPFYKMDMGAGSGAITTFNKVDVNSHQGRCEPNTRALVLGRGKDLA
jgi:hypothetical protein